MSLPAYPEPMPVSNDALVRTVVDDALERDGQMLVLKGSDLTLLSLVASAAVAATLDAPMAVGDLAELLFEQFGRPVDVDLPVAIRQVLAVLVDRGIVEITA